MMTRCEDYPCCGHTDGLGCNWTPPTFENPEDAFEPGSQEYWDARWEREEDEDDECRPHESYCANDDEDCTVCRGYWLDFHADGMEDQWLDGSYEE